jgi:hypothetical protein
VEMRSTASLMIGLTALWLWACAPAQVSRLLRA